MFQLPANWLLPVLSVAAAGAAQHSPLSAEAGARMPVRSRMTRTTGGLPHAGLPVVAISIAAGPATADARMVSVLRSTTSSRRSARTPKFHAPIISLTSKLCVATATPRSRELSELPSQPTVVCILERSSDAKEGGHVSQTRSSPHAPSLEARADPPGHPTDSGRHRYRSSYPSVGGHDEKGADRSPPPAFGSTWPASLGALEGAHVVCLLRAGTLMPAFSTRQTAAHASDEVYVGLLREEEALRDNSPGSHSTGQAT